jgi:hypothetical protein
LMSTISILPHIFLFYIFFNFSLQPQKPSKMAS